jgi:glycerol-3-phosphate dehydrogenase
MYDLLIIGGGINGCAIARDAAGRGLKVMLVEQNDLASATSSASTKLIHGGLRYLESFEFRLVHEALAEREILLSAAPHIIWPLKFILPHDRHQRPRWMIKIGLWLYDHLARRKKLPASEMVKLRGNWFGSPLKEEYEIGFSYADCWVDDARLVVLNAIDAKEHGAEICVGTKLISAKQKDGHWVATLDNSKEVQTRVLVNAAGPWVSEILDNVEIKSTKKVKLVKGSHIVVHKQYPGTHAYILQNRDGRIAFAIPYEGAFTLIGTTDFVHNDAPGPVTISDVETDYLLDLVNHFWDKPVTHSDIVWSYSGLRPLYDDGAVNASVVTRDYAFDINTDSAPILSVFGGKITTARRLAEHALEELGKFIPIQNPKWTKSAVFPGGDMDFDKFVKKLRQDKPLIDNHLLYRLARAYGTRVYDLLGDAVSLEDLGQDFGHGLTETEVDYLIKNEWAKSADDILWRRSKLGLHMSSSDQAVLQRFIDFKY